MHFAFLALIYGRPHLQHHAAALRAVLRDGSRDHRPDQNFLHISSLNQPSLSLEPFLPVPSQQSRLKSPSLLSHSPSRTWGFLCCQGRGSARVWLGRRAARRAGGITTGITWRWGWDLKHKPGKANEKEQPALCHAASPTPGQSSFLGIQF